LRARAAGTVREAYRQAADAEFAKVLLFALELNDVFELLRTNEPICDAADRPSLAAASLRGPACSWRLEAAAEAAARSHGLYRSTRDSAEVPDHRPQKEVMVSLRPTSSPSSSWSDCRLGVLKI
jgi:hypothetical protein